MDRFDVEPRGFYDHQARLLRPHTRRRLDETNLSELEVFMLRGRRLQARTMGEGLRKLFGRLSRLLRRSSGEPSGRAARPDCHSPV